MRGGLERGASRVEGAHEVACFPAPARRIALNIGHDVALIRLALVQKQRAHR